MAWHAPERTCTNCGCCFGDYGADCSWPGGCEGPNGVLRGWKPRKEAAQRQAVSQQATSTSTPLEDIDADLMDGKF